MKMTAKRISLVVCLFLFLFVVIGNGLHLNPAGAFLAAATGTPLLVYLFNQRLGEGVAEERACCTSRNLRCIDRQTDNSADWERESVRRT
jgi:ABC-type arginine/histidine transport system permease subunit